MLTKNDLQQIGQVVDSKLDPLKGDMKTVRNDLNSIKKTVNLIVKNYDEADAKLAKRVKKLEEHIRL